jgi:hypothetical protein
MPTTLDDYRRSDPEYRLRRAARRLRAAARKPDDRRSGFDVEVDQAIARDTALDELKTVASDV